MPVDTLVPAPGVVAVELDGRACVYAPREQQVLLLDDSGTLAWQLLSQGVSGRDALLAEVLARTGAQAALVAPTLEALLERLLAAGALVPAP